MIYPSFDKRPVYLNSNGEPLSFGKLFYYKIGTVTPKEIYSDVELTVLAANPQILDASGRTNTQIFDGVGEYTVIAYKFNGVDPVTADPSDWEIDNQWVESGADPVEPSETLFTVNTISDLRTADPTKHSNVDVLGYYTTTDCFTRNYRWVSDVTQADNGGTIIRNPSISVGAFVLQNAGDSFDVRVFGAIPNKSSITCNSSLSAAAGWVSLAANSATDLFFPSGTYYVTTGSLACNTHTTFDRSVKFFVKASGNYKITFTNRFKYTSNASLTDSTSIGAVLPSMQSQESAGDVIYPMWWAGKSGNMSDATPVWKLMLSNCRQNYTIALIGTHQFVSDVGDLSVYQKIRQVYQGFINFGETSSNLYLGNEVEQNGAHGVFDGVLSHLKNGGLSTLRASMFYPCGYSAMQTTTNNLSTVLGYLKGSYTDLTFKFDAQVNSFTTGFTDDASIRYVYESGKIVAALSPDTTNFVKIRQIAGLTHASLLGSITLQEGVTDFGWFDGDANTAWQQAGQCALRGNGVLDLGGRSVTVGQVDWNKSNQSNSPTLEVRNGRIITNSVDDCGVWLSTASLNQLTLSNLIIENSNYPIGTNTGTSVGTLNLNNVTTTKGTSDSGGYVLYNEGTVSKLNIVNCNLSAGNLVHNTSYLEVNAVNSVLALTMTVDWAKITNCTVGVLGTYTISRFRSLFDVVLTGNTFYDCMVACVAGALNVDFSNTEGSISWIHNITGNTFYRTVDSHTGIYFYADAAPAYYSGVVVEGNNFINRNPAHTGEVVYRWITCDSNAAPGTAQHAIRIADNISNNGIVAQTVGTLTRAGTCTAVDSNGSHLMINIANITSMFIPSGVTPIVLFSNCHIAEENATRWGQGNDAKSYQPSAINPNAGEELHWRFLFPCTLTVDETYQVCFSYSMFLYR